MNVWSDILYQVAGYRQACCVRCSKLDDEIGDAHVCCHWRCYGLLHVQSGESKPDSDWAALDSFADSQQSQGRPAWYPDGPRFLWYHPTLHGPANWRT